MNIAYQVIDGGPLNVVYVPGMLNLIETGTEEPAIGRHIERITAFATVIMFDKRGTGLSDRVSTAEMADAEARVEDVKAVMEAVSLTQATLFATADGVAPAILFAARYPERVDALVIVDGTACYLAAADYDAGFRADPSPPLQVWLERWGNEQAPLSVNALAPSMASDMRWRAALGRMQRRAATPRAAYRYWQDAVIKTDVRAALPHVRAPTLVLHAVGDALFPLAQGRAIAAGIRGARLNELPGEDHFMFFKNAELVAAETQEFLTGTRGSVGGSRHLSTIVFTDIVGSTARAAHLGDSLWRDLLLSHDRVLKDCLHRYNGRYVNSTGDGVLALFDDPDTALDCARALTRGVRDLGLEIRVGAHTGVVEFRDDAVAGMAVNIAARVMAKADASEILVTQTMRDLLIGSSTRFEPRAVHSLKGVPERFALYAVANGGDS